MDPKKPSPAPPSPVPEDTRADSILIEKVLRGDTDAFQPLMEKYQQRIFGYLYRLLGKDVDQAQDLTQAVFLKAYQHLGGYDPSRPLLPWLYRIAHNEAANFLRSRGRKPLFPLEPETGDRLSDDSRESPEGLLGKRQTLEAVRRALQSLKPKYREALLLHYQEEQSYEEISTILGKNISTVGTLIRRGRQALEKELVRMGILTEDP